MVKKKSVKKVVPVKKHKVAKRTVSSQTVEIKMQPVLVQNFVALQKVMVNLSTKFEKLNLQLTKLLELFDMAAKNLMKKDFKFGQEDNTEVVEKLNELTEQNKVLAKGLTLIHEDEQEQKQMIAPPVVPPQLAPSAKVPVPPKPKPLPKPMSIPPAAQKPQGEEEYQKSAPAKSPETPQ